MSYNRGNMRRDSGRRSNDFGGGGGGANRRGGNYYDNYNSQMNPWEGGMVPGRGGGGSGLLPAPGQSDLLSQLTSPEAQLALASNLINKLINQQQQSVPPSLLNLGNMNSGGNRMSSFGGDGYGNTRNFQDRRRGRMDQRRTEPYNKSAMNRRNMGNDRRNLDRSSPRNSDRKTSVAKSPKIQKEEIKKDAEKPNGDVKTESTDDDSKREDGTEGEDGKKNKEPKTPVPPIPAALLYCHVCSKNMWDETSFNKHLNGRPHQLMMDGMSEKYKLKVDLLRHEMRLAEQQREMELERKQRQGMKVFNHPREYCAMCDLHFYGNLIPHRKNLHHQKLKSFLHPKCSHCNKEFSTRQEWDDHRLSFSHLRKVAEFRRATKPNINDDEFDIDELVCPETVNCGDMVNKELPLVSGHPAEDTIGELKEDLMKERDEIKKESKDEEGKTDEKGEEDKEKEEAKKAEDMAAQGADIEPSKLPKYNSANCVGKDLVVATSGFICRVCNRFIPSQDEFQFHCRTLVHYTNYCNMIRAKARVTGRRKRTGVGKKDEKGDEEKTEADESMSVDVKEENAGEDDEGNWKRRKTNENADESIKEEDSKGGDGDESKDDITDVWEEVDKDIDAAYTDGQKEEEEEQEEESSSPRAKRGAKATPTAAPARARRGGRRGK